MSRALTIARNDFRHALRDRLVWGAVVLLGAAFLPSVGSVVPGLNAPVQQSVLSSAGDLGIFSLVVIAAVGYNSITSERADGTVRLVLGLPGTRRDLVLGKLLSRLAIIVLALGVVLVIASGLTARAVGIESLVPFWAMAGWMLLYGTVWTAIAIGYSAAFSSQYRSLGALVVTYGLFSPTVGAWRLFAQPIFAFSFTGSFAMPYYETLAEAPYWVHIMYRTNPLQGFFRMVRWSVSVLTGTTPITGFWLNLAGISVFLGFGALPVLFGMRRFERADLTEEKSGPGWADRLSVSLRSATEPSSGSLSRLPFVSAGDRSRIGPILRGDLNRTLKSWIVQGAILLFVLLVAPSVWQDLRPGAGMIGASQGISPADQVVDLTYTFTLPVLILGTAVGYQAVVGERESGTVRLVLGLPGTRRDLVVGKLLTRVAIVIAAIVPMLLFAEGVLLWRSGDPYLVVFLASAGWILLLSIVWTTFVVGVSAAVSSRYRALAVILGSYLLISPENGIWGSIVRPLIGLAFTGQFSTPAGPRVVGQLGPLWFRYMDRLSPLVALGTIEQTLERATGVTQWYVTAPLVLFSIVITVSFAVGSLYIGYRRFARTDLG